MRVDDDPVGLLYDDTVRLLHETGDFGAYETITFRRIPVRALT
ncbi:hypothetical protein AB0D14_42275 [Streptomyces sp. NPDC048484]